MVRHKLDSGVGFDFKNNVSSGKGYEIYLLGQLLFETLVLPSLVLTIVSLRFIFFWKKDIKIHVYETKANGDEHVVFQF